MNFNPVHGLERLSIMAVAAMLIYIGYHLFCALPLFTARRRSLVLLCNMLPGALLAIMGIAILTSEARHTVIRLSELRRSAFHPSERMIPVSRSHHGLA